MALQRFFGKCTWDIEYNSHTNANCHGRFLLHNPPLLSPRFNLLRRVSQFVSVISSNNTLSLTSSTEIQARAAVAMIGSFASLK